MGDQLPFVDIGIVSSTEPKKKYKAIIESMRISIADAYGLDIEIQETGQGPIMHVKFKSEESFLNAYRRDLDVYGFILKNIQNGTLDMDLYRAENAQNQAMGSHNAVHGEPYVVLKYSSTWKDPMRHRYHFTMEVDHIFGVNSAVEEVEDGFLKFFKERSDFEDSVLDNLKGSSWIRWLELKGLRPDGKFAQVFLNLLKTNGYAN